MAKDILEGQDFCFYYIFRSILLGKIKFGGHKKVGEALHQNAPSWLRACLRLKHLCKFSNRSCRDHSVTVDQSMCEFWYSIFCDKASISLSKQVFLLVRSQPREKWLRVLAMCTTNWPCTVSLVLCYKNSQNIAVRWFTFVLCFGGKVVLLKKCPERVVGVL